MLNEITHAKILVPRKATVTAPRVRPVIQGNVSQFAAATQVETVLRCSKSPSGIFPVHVENGGSRLQLLLLDLSVYIWRQSSELGLRATLGDPERPA